jgi:hypothetical protein
MNQNCKFTLQPVDSIQGYVRLNWTVAEFFTNGGIDKFVNKMASVLNIPPSRIKVAGIRSGSTILDFVIDPETPPVTVQDGSVESTATHE